MNNRRLVIAVTLIFVIVFFVGLLVISVSSRLEEQRGDEAVFSQLCRWVDVHAEMGKAFTGEEIVRGFVNDYNKRGTDKMLEISNNPDQLPVIYTFDVHPSNLSSGTPEISLSIGNKLSTNTKIISIPFAKITFDRQKWPDGIFVVASGSESRQ